jgi:tRNA-dihydrouridine synthase B
MLTIGPYTLPNNLILAPMAGVTDRPFRLLCRRLGAGLAVSEMVAANPDTWHTAKSRRRRDHVGESEPRVIQIAGGDPDIMVLGARFNVAHGAQIVDINMGCPAKKVCKKAAGSALLCDEKLVASILQATVEAVDVPVTLKIRTGPHREWRNGVAIARIAEEAGIASLAVHGRTRAEAYKGMAEYDTIAEIKAAVGIPVIANGDIDSPQKAREVLDYTGVDGLMIGRAAQGRPWIFREIAHYLTTGELLPELPLADVGDILLGHLDGLHDFYGPQLGVRVARKHLGWYLQERAGAALLRPQLMRADCHRQQRDLVQAFFEDQALAAAA